MSEHPDRSEEPVVIKDRRRLDPDTGEVRQQEQEATPEQAESTPDEAVPGTTDTGELAERIADLQRLQAEYANYRKRVERDRELVVATAKAQLVGELLTVLDDVERAEAHGDLTGAFKAVTDKLIETLAKAGLEPFGHEREPFDPTVHEAVQHETSVEVDGPTVTAVLRRGYRLGERVLRPALVAVTDYEAAEEQGSVES